MIYLFILALILVLVFSYDTNAKKAGGKFWYGFVFITLVCVAGLRYKVGGDSLEYFNSFENQIPPLNKLQLKHFVLLRYEPLWILLNSVCKTIVDDFAFFQFVHSIFVNIVLFSFFKKYTPYKFTAVLIYFLFYYLYYNMEVMRESLAISFFLLAYPAMVKNKWAQYYILIICATLCHASSIFLFFIPLFRKKKLTKSTFVKIGVSILLIMVLFNFAPTLIPNEEIRRRFSEYQKYIPSVFGFLYFLCIFFIVPIYIFLKYTRKRPVLFPELVVIYFAIAPMVSYFTGFSRFINYFMPFLTIYFANYLFMIAGDTKYHRARAILITGIFILVFLPKYLYYFRNTSHLVPNTYNYERWYPYTTVFDKQENETRKLLFYRSFDYSRKHIREKE
ncbi:EpsG family protein [Niabella pedocola]|uniref:EpsG family protein n=1 Tax=Niabella pedocola TaxID=1752077 RepID=A0ABS8PJV7_9BACT|nr:EpsG family protein [Niabella pedocola]MCD2421387.1 EpsG family protein [Niabella pedocola]